MLAMTTPSRSCDSSFCVSSFAPMHRLMRDICALTSARSPYPVHYSRAFAFSAFLYPQRQQRSLRFAWRCRQHYGLTLFRMNFRAGRTLSLRRRLIVHGGPVFKDHSSPRTILVHACRHVWLVKTQTFNGSSNTLVVSTHPLLLSAFVLADSALPRGSAYRISGGYVVPKASHRAVTGSACPG